PTRGRDFTTPGRVGDSPILGAGLWVDGDVGAAGSTGRGEANLYNLSSHTIVEEMRRGKHPKDACLEACRRVKANTVEKRLLTDKGLPNFYLTFYAVDRQGRGAGVGRGAAFPRRGPLQQVPRWQAAAVLRPHRKRAADPARRVAPRRGPLRGRVSEEPTLAQIRATRAQLRDRAVTTPVREWDDADIARRVAPGTRVFLKEELFQRTGTFKTR